MRIDQLRYLTEIAKSHSMHATSTKMHISPQALSASIKALENEIGMPVLERSFQGTDLTPLGLEISQIAEEFIVKLDVVFKSYLGQQECEPNYYDFYQIPYDEMDNFAPKLVTDLLHKNFDLPLRSVRRSKEEILQDLDNGKLEIALAYIYKLNGQPIFDEYQKYDCQTLCSMKYCCRVSSRSSLNRYMSVSLNTIYKYTLLRLTDGESDMFEELLRAIAPDQKRQCEIQTLYHQEVYREKLISNHGVSLVPDIPYKDKNNIEPIHGTVEIPIKENLQRELCYIHRKDIELSERSQKFIQILSDHIAYIIREN